MTPESLVELTSSACLEELLARGVAAVHQATAFALDPDEELYIEAEIHRNDPITQVDRDVEERTAGHLEVTGAPIYNEEAHRVKDLETYRGRAWVLGPTDGTLSYVATHCDWAISLALVDDGVPTLTVLADPVTGRLYMVIRGRGVWVQPLPVGLAGTNNAAPQALEWLKDLPSSKGMLIAYYQLTQGAGIGQTIGASRGMCCYGAAALGTVEVAAGGVIVYAQPWPQSWDVVAGTLLCVEIGAAPTQMGGVPFDVRHAGPLLAGAPATHAEVLGHPRAVRA